MTITATPAPATYAPAGHIRIALDAGQHPATGRPLHAEATCGGCAHLLRRVAADGQPRTRCALAVSRRGGPDVRPTYPACDQHEPLATE